MFRHTKGSVDWLIASVDEARAQGLKLLEAIDFVKADWEARTGRGMALVSIKNYYGKQKRLRARANGLPSLPVAGSGAAPFKARQLAPGAVVVAIESGNKFAQIFPTLQEAISIVNGKVDNFEFYEARKLKVGYKTVLVVE